MKAKLRKVQVVLISVTAVLLVLAIALSVAANIPSVQSIAFTYLGRGAATTVPLEGTEDWDTNYYSPKFSTKEEAVENGENVTRELSEEGFVLLKNNGVLPLRDASETTISLIGRGAVDPLYGGSGSGNVDVSTAASPYSGLEQAGFRMDDASYNYFMEEKDNYARCAITMDKYEKSQWLIGEVKNDGSGAVPFNVVGDTAVYVISRAGGEGWDLSSDLLRDAAESAAFAEIVKSGTAKEEYETYVPGQHQLELSTYEKNWLEFCKEKYEHTIVIINSSNIMEMGELEADAGVDAILWVGGPGSTGFDAMGNILSGKVNPSGRTVDIWSADFTKDPTFVNTAAINQYSDIGEGDVAKGDNSIAAAFTTQYEEGIYLGYRYYETAAEEGFIDYDEAVVYPFGYGLSYTEFEQTAKWSHSGDVVTATVTVKNTGSEAGKEVVQMYYTAPYTEGGIEKSSVVLGAFAKTPLIEPGKTAEVTLSLDINDMASYDYKGVKIGGGGYVLEAGDYTLSLRADSHTVLPGEDKTYTVEVGRDVFYNEVTTVADGEILFEKQPAVNRFNDVSAIFKDEPTAGYALPMSRADFAGTFPTAPTEADLRAKNITLTYEKDGETVTETVADQLKIFDASTDLIDEDAEMPTTGAQNGLVLSDMRGVGYGEAIWDDFLDQLTEEDYSATNAKLALASNAYNTPEVASLGKGRTQDFDGPQGFSSLWGSTGCCAYCSEVVIASTWNVELARKMGDAIGEESIVNGYNGWYGPALNIHRSPFSGRNFEYYSEDAYLSGVICAAVVEGAADKGCYAYIKHFALNDTEVKRTTNQCTWATEQTIREIYLKPFQYVVENTSTEMKYISDNQGTVSTVTMPGLKAIMSSFNRIGGTWAGGSYALMNEVLRGEWAFRGVAISDFNLYDYMPADEGLRAGTDMQLSFGKDFADTESATARQAMRTAYKNMCYTVVNSNFMQGVAPGAIVEYGLAWWQVTIIVVDVVVGLLAVALVVWIVLDLRRRSR